jgi:hypothetical protein
MANPTMKTMKRLLLAALAAASFAINVHAQSTDAGPCITPAGALQFVRDDRDYVVMFDNQVLDRFDANTLVHFDDSSAANGKLSRTLVQTDTGPILIDARRNPPLVQRTNKRMIVKRVFWQGDEVVMQGSQGWYRFQRGVLTKLQSSTNVYH